LSTSKRKGKMLDFGFLRNAKEILPRRGEKKNRAVYDVLSGMQSVFK
jgi:hypothetical protein